MIYFGTIKLYYSTYIDLDSLTLITGFWLNDAHASSAEWQFHNTVWDVTDRFAKEIAEHAETVKDPNTNVVITDNSDNSSKFVHDYSLFVNDTYTIHDYVEVLDPWTLEQYIKFTSIDGELYWFNSDLHYNGDHWTQTISWNGQNEILLEYDDSYYSDSFLVDTKDFVMDSRTGIPLKVTQSV